MVQIGALSSPALADKAWSDAARLAPGLAAGKGKKVEAIDKNGTTLYRTSVTRLLAADPPGDERSRRDEVLLRR